MKQGLVQKATYYLSSESWDTKTSGVFSFVHCKPVSVWSFSARWKAMPRRASSHTSTASPWPDPPWSATLWLPTLFVVCNSSRSVLHRTISEPLLKTGTRHKLQACVLIFLRGTKWNYLLGKTSPNIRVSAYFLSHLLSILTVALPLCSILLMHFCKASWKILALFYAVLGFFGVVFSFQVA